MGGWVSGWERRSTDQEEGGAALGGAPLVKVGGWVGGRRDTDQEEGGAALGGAPLSDVGGAEAVPVGEGRVRAGLLGGWVGEWVGERVTLYVLGR